jgi:hypothetical protein
MTVNVTLLVYAIPVVAILVAIMRLVVGRMLARAPISPGPPVAKNRWQQNPVPGIVFGVAGLGIGAFMFTSADADQRVYAAEPSCTQGFAAPIGGAGICRLASMRIARWYWSGGRHSRRHLVLSDVNGQGGDVTYGRDLRGSVWRGIYNDDDRAATVQLFKSDIVLIETRSGLAATDLEPRARVDLWALFGICAGFLGMVSALRACWLRGPLVNARA